MPTKTLGPTQLRQNCHERTHTRVRAPTEKVHGRVNFSEHTLFSVSSKNYTSPAYSLMICNKIPVKSLTQNLSPTTVLLDTGASVSSMPLWQANALSVEVKPRTDIVIRGADGKLW